MALLITSSRASLLPSLFKLLFSLTRLWLAHSQRPLRATKSQLTRFHTDEYIDLLERVMPETAEELTGGGTRCLTGEDCPAFEGVFEFCTISAGGSIGAAERINEGVTDIAINWAGGLHHAKKTEASGFCYVNDMWVRVSSPLPSS